MARSRVEKYKEYREEIERSDGRSSQTTRKTSSYIDSSDYENIKNMDRSTFSISYDEIGDDLSEYEEKSRKNQGQGMRLPYSKKKILFYVFTSILLIILAITLIYLAVRLWGGN